MAERTPPQRLAESVLEPGFIETDLPNWESFQDALQSLRTKYDKTSSELLFRGQTDSEFRLSTSLERAGCEGMTFDSYYRLVVARVLPAVETFTGVKWGVPNYSMQIETSFFDREIHLHFPGVELYRYLVYLRHHGFPSPLLDWSRSPYVAVFFAFRDLILRPGDGKPEKRSIYVYCETPQGSKGGAVGAPAIRRMGPYVRSHPRHFRQQSNYTFCSAYDENLAWRFHPHEDVFGRRGARQDLLWKFNLPSSESSKVLRLMDEFNLNAFSLYDSEEALLETMWAREEGG